MDKVENTEVKILRAASQIFHQKGFNGSRMQEIADLAGINKALLHYYFRNKETLFEEVFAKTFSQIISKMKEIFLSDLPLQSKVKVFVDFYLNFILEHSYIIQFLINAIREKPESLKEIIQQHNLTPELFLEKIGQQLKEEMNLDIDPLHIYVNIIALTIFPVAAKPLLQAILSYSDEKMRLFFEERKNIVPTFIENALKGYEKKQILF